MRIDTELDLVLAFKSIRTTVNPDSDLPFGTFSDYLLLYYLF